IVSLWVASLRTGMEGRVPLVCEQAASVVGKMLVSAVPALMTGDLPQGVVEKGFVSNGAAVIGRIINGSNTVSGWVAMVRGCITSLILSGGDVVRVIVSSVLVSVLDKGPIWMRDLYDLADPRRPTCVSRHVPCII